MTWEHTSVMPDESLHYLDVQSEGVYLDATVGLGGHSERIIQMLQGGGVIGIDADTEALAIAQKRLKDYRVKITLEHSNFVEIDEVLQRHGIEEVDGILADLGVSSMELDNPDRGFSFQQDGPLDMRLDATKESVTAADIVNSYSLEELSKIFREYGDEPYPGRIARTIVERRRKEVFATTQDLVQAILSVVPQTRKQSIHPATRVFQALRIEVNNELQGLRIFLQKSYVCLKPRGRLVVISFHSGEDRIVKQTLKQWHTEKKGEILTKKPVCPSVAEISSNPRSRSAKMRVFVKA